MSVQQQADAMQCRGHTVSQNHAVERHYGELTATIFVCVTLKL